MEESKYIEVGSFIVYGDIEDYSSRVSVNVIVESNNEDKDDEGEAENNNGNGNKGEDNNNEYIGNEDNRSNNDKDSLPSTGNENLGIILLAISLLIGGSLLLKVRKKYN
ncbi:MAG: LPXTG cell wall anchor domain-containing protein [Clostridium sp.]|uniref:LPXTG cell wall anchor domain-containing protein n=1 Tax=Clostridium sp. TaxID=1506 RepID=UPI001D2E8325|nr:LPXTG cell wall anchor domain-containing protein [Clostridium sp.]MBS5952139.1 LPXTG cell wall anchor domain-containing protein [Clostridium sp.]